MEQSYNARCPAVKRLLREAKELHEATEEYYAEPLSDNLFEWHFTVRGPPQTDFDGGVYHGRIVMPPEYPMKPPNIIFLTPNGRFETNKKICLSISGHHPETWQPSWSIRTALLAIIGFMPTPANGTLGSLEYTTTERGRLAKKSLEFKCPECGNIAELLLERTSDNEELQREAREVLTQVAVATKSESISEEKFLDMSSNSAQVNAPLETNNSNTPDRGTRDTTTSEINRTTSDDDVIMEGAAPRTSPVTFNVNSPQEEVNARTITADSGSGFFNNFVLSAAVFLFVALLLRRLFLLEADTSEEFEEILL